MSPSLVHFNLLKSGDVYDSLLAVSEFKSFFLKKVDAKINDPYETANVWAQFVQRYMQTATNTCLFINNIAITSDLILKAHLKLKGFYENNNHLNSDEDSINNDQQEITDNNQDHQSQQSFLEELEVLNGKIVEKYSTTLKCLLSPMNTLIQSFDVHQIDFDSNNQENQSLEDTTKDSSNLTQQFQIFQFNSTYFDVLTGSFIGPKETLTQQIFLSLFWSEYLGGDNGQHWGVPRKMFKLLQERLNVEYELFASPLQHTMKQYFSMLDRDRLFGSLGSFMDEYAQTQGNFDANPPFVDSLFTEFAERIVYIIQQQTLLNKECGGLILFPWRDTYGYYRLMQCEYFIDEIELLKNCHYYVEPATDLPIKAKFDSYFLVVGNQLFKERYQAQPYLPDDIVEAFQM